MAGILIRWQLGPLKPSSGGQDESHADAADRKTRFYAAVDAVTTSMVILGAFLGWQACGQLMLLILPVTAVTGLYFARQPENDISQLVAPVFFVLLFGFVLFWRRLDGASSLPSYNGWAFMALSWQAEWLITLAASFLFASLVRFILAGSAESNAESS